MGDAQHPVLRRIEIGIENAAAAAELQLQAGALANLKGGGTELPDQLRSGEADQPSRLRLSGLSLGRRQRGLLRSRSAGGEQQGQGKYGTAHG